MLEWIVMLNLLKLKTYLVWTYACEMQICGYSSVKYSIGI
jgi:hypothetical protein